MLSLYAIPLRLSRTTIWSVKTERLKWLWLVLDCSSAPDVTGRICSTRIPNPYVYRACKSAQLCFSMAGSNAYASGVCPSWITPHEWRCSCNLISDVMMNLIKLNNKFKNWTNLSPLELYVCVWEERTSLHWEGWLIFGPFLETKPKTSVSIPLYGS